MTDGNDVFERNLERLIRSAADPPPDPARARREFLGRVEGRAPFNVRLGRRIAMAAALIVVAALLYSAFETQAPAKPVPPARLDEAATTPGPARVDRPSRPDEPPPKKEERREASSVAVAPSMPARDGEMTMACTLPPPRIAKPFLKLEGTAPFPDGTLLVVSVDRVCEQGANDRLVPGSQRAGGGNVEVRGKRFSISPEWAGAGRYVVTVTLHGSQRPELADSLKGIPRRTSTFEFLAWGDDLARQLGSKLLEVDALAKECADLLARVEKLVAKESTWIKERRNPDARGADIILTKEAEDVVKEAGRLMTRLGTSEVKTIFPASLGELFFTVRSLQGSAQHFEYEAGKFARAKSYHSGEAIKTHRGDAFSFDVLKKYAGEAGPLAGREAALWIVKDLQRTGAQMRPDLADTLKTFGAHPGLAAVADRLGKAAAEDLEGLEKEIRSAPGH